MCPSPAPSDPRQESLGMLLGLVKTEMVRALQRELAAQGVELPYTQFLAMKRLATLGPMSASELARSLDHDAGAMTRLLDQLEGRGYVRRLPHEQDRRTLRIELTAAGEAQWSEIAEANQRLLDRAQRDLDPRERTQLLDYLGRVLGALRSSD
jgi:DNA-binding MarR family transcriptional regulator